MPLFIGLPVLIAVGILGMGALVALAPIWVPAMWAHLRWSAWRQRRAAGPR